MTSAIWRSQQARRNYDARSVKPLERLEAGSGEVASAEFEYHQARSWAGSEVAVREYEFRKDLERFQELTGTPFPIPEAEGPSPKALVRRAAGLPNIPRSAYKRFAETVAGMPEIAGQFDLDYDKRVQNVFDGIANKRQEAEEYSRDFLSWAAGVAGMMGAYALEPLALGTTAVTAGLLNPATTGLARAAATEFVVGAGTEVVQIPAVSRQAEMLGEEYGLGTAIADVAIGGTASAALYTTGRVALDGYKKLAKSDYKIDYTDAAADRHLQHRQTEVDQSLFAATDITDAAEQLYKIDVATHTIASGRMLDPADYAIDPVRFNGRAIVDAGISARSIGRQLSAEESAIYRAAGDDILRSSSAIEESIDKSVLDALRGAKTAPLLRKMRELQSGVDEVERMSAMTDAIVTDIRNGYLPPRQYLDGEVDAAALARLDEIDADLSAPSLPAKKRKALEKERALVEADLLRQADELFSGYAEQTKRILEGEKAKLDPVKSKLAATKEYQDVRRQYLDKLKKAISDNQRAAIGGYELPTKGFAVDMDGMAIARFDEVQQTRKAVDTAMLPEIKARRDNGSLIDSELNKRIDSDDAIEVQMSDGSIKIMKPDEVRRYFEGKRRSIAAFKECLGG